MVKNKPLVVKSGSPMEAFKRRMQHFLDKHSKSKSSTLQDDHNKRKEKKVKAKDVMELDEDGFPSPSARK